MTIRTISEHLADRTTYDRLHAKAKEIFESFDKKAGTLQATAVLNETWARLEATYSNKRAISEEELIKLASTVIRRFLTDHIRKKYSTREQSAKDSSLTDRERLADKQALYQRVHESLRQDDAAFDPASLIGNAEQAEMLTLALEQLEADDPVASEVIDMHFFGDVSIPEIARTLEKSLYDVRKLRDRGLDIIEQALNPNKLSNQ